MEGHEGRGWRLALRQQEEDAADGHAHPQFGDGDTEERFAPRKDRPPPRTQRFALFGHHVPVYLALCRPPSVPGSFSDL